MEPLNGETSVENISSRLAVAQDLRNNATLRADVKQTPDTLALNRMNDYIKEETDILDLHKDSEVAAFYAGRSVLITGASGFVGKCLLEKLLRSCPDIREVFILIRPKQGRDVCERVEILLRSNLFDRLRNSSNGQKQLNKVMPIRGDITLASFGLSQRDIGSLQRVSLVFHSAATVKFVEPMKVAIENNVVSVDNLVNLASKLANLEAMVHVSTAYSNCDRVTVEEVFYETPIEADKLIEMSQWMDEELFEKIAPILLGKRPNTYTYTKAVAESLLLERSKKLLPNVPIAMVRPSIVGGIWRQPIPGWVDNFNGPTGVILAMSTGAIQAMLACPNFCADIVPVDIVANLIICTAWQVHQQKWNATSASAALLKTARNSVNHQTDAIKSREQAADISIFNCVSGTLNPVTWREVAKYVNQISFVYPCNTLMRSPSGKLLSNELYFVLYSFINHKIFAYAGDFFLRLARKKSMFVIIYNRMAKMITTLKPFTTNQWLFDCSNVTSLYERLTPVDKEIFNFDIRQVRWDDYIRRYYVGSKVFALKDDPKKLLSARQKLRKIELGSKLSQIALLLLVYYFIISGTSIEQSMARTVQQVVASLTQLVGESNKLFAGVVAS